MNHVVALGLFAVLVGPPWPPSDPAAAYAILDKVVLLPNAENPQQVELWGSFCIAEGDYGEYYRAPRQGVLLLGAAGEARAASVAQWRELQTLAAEAGRPVVCFGSRYEMQELQVAAADAPRPKAAGYAPAMGVRKLRAVDYGPARELRLLPRPLQPAPAGEFVALTSQRGGQLVEFEIENCQAQAADLQYLFTVATNDGEQFASPPVTAGERTTKWSTNLMLQAGERVTWTVHAVQPKLLRAPIATAAFVCIEGKKARQ